MISPRLDMKVDHRHKHRLQIGQRHYFRDTEIKTKNRHDALRVNYQVNYLIIYTYIR